MAPWVVPAIVAAGSVLSSLLSNKGGAEGGQMSDTAKYWTDVTQHNALQQYKKSQAARDATNQRLTDFITGGGDYTKSPMWAPAKAATEDAYGTAKMNIMANLPSGGALQESLANADMARAQQLSSVGADIFKDDWDKVYGMVYGQPQSALSYSGPTGANEAMANATQKAGKAQGLGQLGQGLGYYFGSRPNPGSSTPPAQGPYPASEWYGY